MTVGIPSFDPTGALRSISAELLLQHIEARRPMTIVDVRTCEESRGPSGRIPFACSIPLHQLVARRNELLPHRHNRIVLVSYLGLRARVAAFGLSFAGFEDVVWLEGGLEKWLGLGYRIDRGSQPFLSSA